MIAFQPQSTIYSFTGAGTPPTSVQVLTLSNVGVQAYVVENISGSVDCVIGWGASDAEAKVNAAAGTSVTNCYYMPFGKQRVVIGPRNAYFTGKTAASTAVIKVQAGIAT